MDQHQINGEPELFQEHVADVVYHFYNISGWKHAEFHIFFCQISENSAKICDMILLLDHLCLITFARPRPLQLH